MPIKACVVGSGPAGLVSAFSLLEAGFEPDEIIVLERRPKIGERWNVVQLAALSLARFDTFKSADGTESVLSSMLSHGVLGKVSTMHSRIESRLGKPNSERSNESYVASPSERVIDLFVDIEGREWDGEKWNKTLKDANGKLVFKKVAESLFGAPYSAYISDIERHLQRVGGLRGIKVAFACDTELVYDEAADRYEVVVTRREPETAQPDFDSLLPRGKRTSLGVPALIVVAEGGSRNLLKSQGILQRHRVEIKLKSVSKYFAAALTRHPQPSQLIPVSSILGETHHFSTPDQEPKWISIVSGNVITRAPRYLAMEQTNGRDEHGATIPPDTWFVRVPNDDLALERLPGNTNPQDFGIVEYTPTAAMTSYVAPRIRSMLAHFSNVETAEKAEIIKIARPFPQTDTVLDRAAFGNIAVFGDAARTGSFLSGMGMNSLICLNSQDLVTYARTIRADPTSLPAAAKAYTLGIHGATSDWHAMTKIIQSEIFPPWMPDLEVAPLPKEALDPVERKEVAEPPMTVLKFRTIEGMQRYAIANWLLNNLVPVKFLRVGMRRVVEWLFGSAVKREDIEGKVHARL